ncbi:MAG: HU family DNA-binding protein, partial [Pyrinomonadaceae bacterium]
MAASKTGKAAGAKTAAPSKISGKRMTQSEVLSHFAQKFEMKRADAKEFFNEMAELAAREVKRNGEFVLPGFGKMVLAKRKAREGRNPATGETIQIAASNAAKFSPASALKKS